MPQCASVSNKDLWFIPSAETLPRWLCGGPGSGDDQCAGGSLSPQSRQRINPGRSPCRRIASQNRGVPCWRRCPIERQVAQFYHGRAGWPRCSKTYRGKCPLGDRLVRLCALGDVIPNWLAENGVILASGERPLFGETPLQIIELP
jgi:hypothetical protein